MATTRERRRGEIDPAVEAAPPSGWREWLERLTTREADRLAGFGGAVLGGVAAAIIILYLFVWVADQVLDQATQTVDVAVLGYLHQFVSPQLTQAAIIVSLFGSEAIWAIGLVLLAIFGWQRRWGAAGMLILVTAGAQLLNDLLKQIFHRTRPEPIISLISAQQYSFPSGHAMVSSAFYGYLAYLAWRLLDGWRRALVVTLLFALVLLIGLSRLYLAAHYFSDVIAGYLAGFLWTDAIVLGSRVLSLRPSSPAEISAPQYREHSL